jgi:predicted RNA binding protein YcfA (HicA-like mRNA interferase family)
VPPLPVGRSGVRPGGLGVQHLRKRYSPLPFREVKRRLEAAGFAEANQKGSHVKFVRRTGDYAYTAIDPRHSEIAVGTLRSILRQARIDPEEWEHLAH